MAWKKITNRKEKAVRRELFCYVGHLAEEMNRRLLMEQKLEQEFLFVESITIMEIRFASEKRRRRGSMMKWKDKVFSDRAVNSGRQQELDLAKSMPIVCLGMVHCVIECTPEEQLAEGIPFLFDSVIGGPLGAPLFMFAMGIGMAYTVHNTFREYIRRGADIIAAGYLLNICRFLIPFLIGYGITGDGEKYMEPLLYRFLGNDILQFAGLAMVLIGLWLRLGMSDAGMFLACLAMSLLGTYLNGKDFGIPFYNIFFGHLIGTEDAAGMVVSDFPLMNWLLVPVSGYWFGKRLLHVKNKRLFYGVFSTVCLLMAAVYFFIGIQYRLGMFGEGQNCYYHITTWDCAASLTAAVASLGMCYAAARHIPDRVMERVAGISRNINAVYCIQWVLVAVSINLALYGARGTQTLGLFWTMLAGSCISAVSVWAAPYLTAYRKKKKGERRGKAYGNKKK